VGLDKMRTRPPQMLSGGQKQLVAIAGALATYDPPERPDVVDPPDAVYPPCIVLDEPTSMLDPASRQQVLSAIRRLNQQRGLTVILITQSMDEAATAQRVLVMDQGRIVMDGTPQEIFAAGWNASGEEQIRALGLGLPAAVEIAVHLRRLGIALPANLLTVEALAAALGDPPDAVYPPDAPYPPRSAGC
jgi:energy-coupling factor transport system ATP-binding protein